MQRWHADTGCADEARTLKKDRRATGAGVSPLPARASKGHIPANPGEPFSSGTYAASMGASRFGDTANPATPLTASFPTTPAAA